MDGAKAKGAQQAMSRPRTPILECRVCGCTDMDPCVNSSGETCGWVHAPGPAICTFCFELEQYV